MTRDEISKIARAVATERRWPWEEPIVVRRERRFVLFGRRTKWLVSPSALPDARWSVAIEDRTGRVVWAEC